MSVSVVSSSSIAFGDSPVSGGGSPPASDSLGPGSSQAPQRPSSQPMRASSSGGSPGSTSGSFIPTHFVPNTFETLNQYYAESPMWNIPNQSAPFLVRDQLIVDPRMFGLDASMYTGGVAGPSYTHAHTNGHGVSVVNGAPGTMSMPLQSVPGGIVQNVFITPGTLHPQMAGATGGRTGYVYAGSAVGSMPPSMASTSTNRMSPGAGGSRSSHSHPYSHSHPHSQSRSRPSSQVFAQGMHPQTQAQHTPIYHPPSGPPPSHHHSHSHSHSQSPPSASVFEPTGMNIWQRSGGGFSGAPANIDPQLDFSASSALPNTTSSGAINIHHAPSTSVGFTHDPLMSADGSWLDPSALGDFTLVNPDGGLGEEHWA